MTSLGTILFHTLSITISSSFFAGVPIPEESAAAGEQVESAIKRALEECEEKKIQGTDVTPFLLERIRELTGGASLEANIALVKNNARIGAQVAVCLSKMVGNVNI